LKSVRERDGLSAMKNALPVGKNLALRRKKMIRRAIKKAERAGLVGEGKRI